MPSNSAAFTIEFASTLNLQGVSEGVRGLVDTVSKLPPLVINTGVRNVDTGDAQQILNSIQQQATAIDSVTVKQKNFTNAAGETRSVLTQMTTVWTDGAGRIRTTTQNITNDIKNMGKEWKLTSTDVVKDPIQKNMQQFQEHYKKQGESFDAMQKKAQEWNLRADSMNQKEKAPLKESIALLNEKIQKYRDLIAAGNIPEANKMADEIREQNKVVQDNIALTKMSANAVQGWSTRLGNAIKQSISYAFSLGLMRMAQQQFNQALQYTIELNKQMTNIQLLQVEGARTPAEINALADSYNRLAIELGSTTIEVAKGSVEWLRQGKTISETAELLRSSTMLSKLGNIEAAESTEFLTSALNGYNLEADKAVGIVDKLIAVDNVAATSAKELATALRYSSAVASQAGVSIEELISYIGVISSTTRQNAEMIGQALKTIFTRMQDIKQGGLDEDGLGINNVERALERVKIKLRDSDTSFRNLSDVLEDIAGKWSTLNEVEQANIAKAVAGVRQQNMFMILMTNMNKALELQEVQYNSAGLAADRYEIYLKSVEAAQNRVKASLEGLYQNAIESGFIVSLLDATSAIIEFVDNAGGIPTLLGAIAVGFMLIKAQAIGAAIPVIVNAFFNLSFAIGTVQAGLLTTSEAFVALFGTATIATGGLILIAAAVVALGGYLYYVSKEAERAKKTFDELTEASLKSSEEFKKASEAPAKVKALWEEYNELKDIINKTTEETRRLIDVQNELNELSNYSISGHYNETMDFVIDYEGELTRTNQLLREQLQIKKDIAKADAEAAIKAGLVVAEDLKKEKEKLETKVGTGLQGYRALSPYADQATIQKMYDEDVKRIREITLEQIAQQNSVFDHYRKLQTEQEQTEFIAMLEQYKAEKGIIDLINAYKKDMAIKARVEEENERLGLNIQSPVRFGFIEALDQAKILEKQFKVLQETKQALSEGNLLGLDRGELEKMGFDMEALAKGGSEAAKEFDKYNDSIEQQLNLIGEENPQLEEQLRLLLAGKDATEEQTYSLDDLISAQQTLSDAIDEFNSTGELSLSTVMSLIDAGYSEAIMFDSVTGKAYLNEGALRKLQLANADLAVATAWAKLEAFDHVNGLEAERLALLGTWKAAVAAKNALLNLAGMPITTSAPASGGGGGGKSEEEKQYEAEIKAIEEKIEAYEDEKKALKEKLDLFKEYIDAQKESLQRAKEEADWNKELAKKSTDLAKIKSRIALLALDDSAEARAERLKLEEQAGELETEITEDTEDRKYDLQIQALDDLEKAFEDNINAQIDAIDDVIDKYKEEIEGIREVMQALNGGGGGGGGGGSDLKTAAQDTYNKIIEQIRLAKQFTDEQKMAIMGVIAQMLIAGKTAEDLQRIWDRMKIPGFLGKTDSNGNWSRDAGTGTVSRHSGGLIESHHGGNFAGNLNSNEVFAKLLKGEYVATEGQMNNFLRNILPKIMNIPTGTSINEKIGDTNIQIHINVEGSLDKTVLPDLRTSLLKEVNKAMQMRGVKRTAGSFSI